MPGLESFKEQYPAYKDIPDQELADALHTKYYSNIPKEEYYQKLGLKTENSIQEQPQSVGDKLLEAVGRGIENIPSQVAALGESAYKFISEPQKAPERLANVAKGVPQGLGNALIGGVQFAANLGEEGARAIEKKIYGDNALPENNKSNFTGRLNEEVKKRLEEQAKLPKSEQIGIGIGESAPYLAVGGKTAQITGAAAGAGLSSFLAPQKEESLINRATGAVESATSAAGLTGLVKGAGKVVEGADKFINPNIDKKALQEAKDLGIKPTLGQVSNNNTIKYAEAGLEKIPGSAGTIQKAREETFGKIQDQLKNIAPVKPLSNQEASELLQKGATNQVKRFNEISEKIYGRLDRYVSKDAPIATSNTAQTIQNTLAALPREAAASARAKTDTAFNIINDLGQDIKDNAGKLDYRTAKYYRQEIGSQLNQKAIIGDTNTGNLKQLYGALSKDMEQAFKDKSPQAAKAFQNANEFYSKGLTEIEDRLGKLINNKDPDRVFTYAMSGTKEGGTKINSIIKTLSPPDRELLRSSVINKFGLDTTTNEFSPNQFVRHYQALSPEAKRAIFDEKQRIQLDKLSNVINRIKTIERKTNSSNTATHLTLGALGFGFLGATHTAQVIGSAYVTGKLFTNPKFIDWLSKFPEIKNSGQFSNHIKKLSIIAQRNPDLRPDIRDYLQSLNSNDQQQ
jgi:hypothetical protein